MSSVAQYGPNYYNNLQQSICGKIFYVSLYFFAIKALKICCFILNYLSTVPLPLPSKLELHNPRVNLSVKILNNIFNPQNTKLYFCLLGWFIPISKSIRILRDYTIVFFNILAINFYNYW